MFCATYFDSVTGRVLEHVVDIFEHKIDHLIVVLDAIDELAAIVLEIEQIALVRRRQIAIVFQTVCHAFGGIEALKILHKDRVDI